MNRTEEPHPASCQAAGTCGACQLLNVSYETQLQKKRRCVQKLLGDSYTVYPVEGMKSPWHYRNKVHAAFGRRKDGSILYGTYRAGSHYIVETPHCLLEDETAQAIIRDIALLARQFRVRIYQEDTRRGVLRRVLVRVGHATGQVLVALVVGSPVFPSRTDFVRALLAMHPEITTVVQSLNTRTDSMILGEQEKILYGKGYIEDVLCGLSFRISAASFYQVNSLQTEKLYQKAIALAALDGTQRVIDAYCGIGTIGLIAAGHAKSVIGMESNANAVKDAIRSAKQNGISNERFWKVDATEGMRRMAAAGERADVLFLDPPRAGSTQAFVRAAAQLGPKRIVYISCNPETLARDLKWFAKEGYASSRAWPFDLFPMCEGHIETVVPLTPAKRSGQGKGD